MSNAKTVLEAAAAAAVAAASAALCMTPKFVICGEKNAHESHAFLVERVKKCCLSKEKELQVKMKDIKSIHDTPNPFLSAKRKE